MPSDVHNDNSRIPRRSIPEGKSKGTRNFVLAERQKDTAIKDTIPSASRTVPATPKSERLSAKREQAPEGIN